MGVAAIPLAVAAVGTVVSAGSAVAAGQSRKAAAEYQAQVARNNEIVSQQKAADAIDRGKVAESRRRLQTRQLIGSQRATLAANGVEVDQGSALDLTADTATTGELDALTIRNNAQREALGFQSQADEFGGEQRLRSRTGRDAQTQGFLGAGSTVLTGGSKVAGRWYDLAQSGAL